MINLKEGFPSKNDALQRNKQILRRCENLDGHREFLIASQLKSGDYEASAKIMRKLLLRCPTSDRITGFTKMVKDIEKKNRVVALKAIMHEMPFLAADGIAKSDLERIVPDQFVSSGAFVDATKYSAKLDAMALMPNKDKTAVLGALKKMQKEFRGICDDKPENEADASVVRFALDPRISTWQEELEGSRGADISAAVVHCLGSTSSHVSALSRFRLAGHVFPSDIDVAMSCLTSVMGPFRASDMPRQYKLLTVKIDGDSFAVIAEEYKVCAQALAQYIITCDVFGSLHEQTASAVKSRLECVHFLEKQLGKKVRVCGL